jgi:hypothetical protein
MGKPYIFKNGIMWSVVTEDYIRTCSSFDEAKFYALNWCGYIHRKQVASGQLL